MIPARPGARAPDRALTDSFGRTFEYLRLSLTDRCNFKCAYCLPEGYQARETEPELSVPEIRNLVSAFARMGFWKVRLTGGEPTLRRDLVEIVSAVSSVPGVSRVALSTNGYRLRELAPALRAAGVSALNISLDSLEEARFREITGDSRFAEVVAGIDAALECGFPSVKLNAVLLRGLNDGSNGGGLARFLEFARSRPVTVRFIELMRTGSNGALFERRHVGSGELQHELRRSGWTEVPRQAGDGPAVAYSHPEYRGRIGIIAPYAEGFCDRCNRLRVSARGRLRLCLFGDGELGLRRWLKDESQAEELIAEVRRAIATKPVSHFLHQGNYGTMHELAQIGG